MNRTRAITAGGLLGLLPPSGLTYPVDGYHDTGIRRVEGSRLAHEGLARGSIPVLLPARPSLAGRSPRRLFGH